jgi:hypothetical protein
MPCGVGDGRSRESRQHNVQNPETFFAGPGKSIRQPHNKHGSLYDKVLSIVSQRSAQARVTHPCTAYLDLYTLRTNSCMAASRVEAVLWELFDRMVPQGRAFELSLLNVAAANFQHIPGRTRQVRLYWRFTYMYISLTQYHTVLPAAYSTSETKYEHLLSCPGCLQPSGPSGDSPSILRYVRPPSESSASAPHSGDQVNQTASLPPPLPTSATVSRESKGKERMVREERVVEAKRGRKRARPGTQSLHLCPQCQVQVRRGFMIPRFQCIYMNSLKFCTLCFIQ